jgi:cellulose biosynthesis protein BcsQ
VIVTFYSYKGGTGRTMALANIACLLAKAGRRVLVVDFDLEAPGVWRYFAEFDRGLEHRPGLIELLMAQVIRTRPDMQSAQTPAPPDWRKYTARVRIGAESVTLLTSGLLDDEYPARVLAFDWDEFFRSHDGGEFFERLRDEWNSEFDFVLIDSRTGITDIGGICTIQLPDMIVPVFVANGQNLDGVVDTLRRAQRGRQALAYDRPPALVLPVLSRFDSRTELESANEWLTRAANLLGEFYADWLPRTVEPRVALERTKLPHIAYFGFGEKLAVLLQGVTDPESLGYALASIARLIDSHLKDAPAVILGTGDPPAGHTSPIRLEPSSDSWIAAIYHGRTLLGPGVLIDRDRVLTAVDRVLTAEASTYGATPLSVRFPKSDDRDIREERYEVSDVLKGEPGRLCIIRLRRNVPLSLSAAALRFPHGRDLVGHRWWAFGFPAEQQQQLGATASGTVGAALGYGSIRLDTESRYGLVSGFSGSPVWAPDYSAVVGIVTHAELGSGIAIPLAEAADDFPEERLIRLTGDKLDQILDKRQRSEFIAELAKAFPSGDPALSLQEDIGIPAWRIRDGKSFRNSNLYWEQVVTDLENGMVVDGLAKLAARAAAMYPGNRVFAATAGYLRDARLAEE